MENNIGKNLKIILKNIINIFYTFIEYICIYTQNL